MAPAWSSKAKRAVSVFFRQWNDIDVFVEDLSSVTLNIYSELLNRLSNGKFKIEKVFPLGSRINVIEQCVNYKKDGRPKIFIIDGDLELMVGESLPNCPELYKHDRYCVENYLLDEEAIVEILYEEDPSKTRVQIRDELAFKEWLENNSTILSELFIIYAVMRKFLPGVKTVNNGIGSFLSNDGKPKLDQNKISEYIGQMHSDLCEIYSSDVILKNELIFHQKILDGDMPSFISGKDYWFPLINIHIRCCAKIKATKDSFKMRLAKICDLKAMEGLKKHMEKVSAA